MPQERIRTQPTETSSTAGSDEQEELAVPHGDHKSAEELKSELDALLDEIDDVLEKNAEEFVANYLQRGGE